MATALAIRSVAAELSARASVDSARASLSTDETNLSKASIRSPINGVVLTRTVDPGNAVAASLQAVTLFTIAEDLSQLQLKVNVDEAADGVTVRGLPDGPLMNVPRFPPSERVTVCAPSNVPPVIVTVQVEDATRKLPLEQLEIEVKFAAARPVKVLFDAVKKGK